jgi:hypothetical protein
MCIVLVSMGVFRCKILRAGMRASQGKKRKFLDTQGRTRTVDHAQPGVHKARALPTELPGQARYLW